MATFTFTRKQLLTEADRYIFEASKLPDSNVAKQQYIRAASDLSNVVMTRIYNAILASEGNIPDDLEH